MNVALRRPMTVDAFLAWEERQERHCEFDGVRALAMTGGTLRHAAIQANLTMAPGGRLAEARHAAPPQAIWKSGSTGVSATPTRW